MDENRPMSSPRRVVVTGASGMFGTHMVEHLRRRGDDVVALDLDVSEPVADVRQVAADVRDTDAVRRACRGADVVVHAAAALPSYPAEEIVDVDVRGTGSVLAAAQEADVGRVVHLSSTAVYGLPARVPTPETADFGPVDPYSRAKIAAEQACRAARRAGAVVPVLRPKTFLGPNRLGLFAMLFQWADEGRHFPLLDGGRVRCQMLDVEDLVEATTAAMDRPARAVNTDFNIGADDFGTLAEDFQSVLDDAGYGRRIRSVPAGPAVRVLQALDAAGLSPVYGRLLHKLRGDSFVSTERAARVLGVRPRWSNRDAIQRTYRWWRESQSRIAATSSGRTHREPWRQGALAVAKLAY